MKITSMTPRPRWRVSEKVAAELEHARQLAGCRSWDEYFSLLMCQSDPSVHQEPQPPDNRMKALQQEHQEFRAELIAIRHLLEVQEQANQAAEHERAETYELLRRLHELLSLALAPEEPSSEPSDELDSVRDAVLHSIRHGGLLASMK